ncbi:hypothetical protein ACFL1E_04945 [Candidatus Omnitrophota bacterium]
MEEKKKPSKVLVIVGIIGGLLFLGFCLFFVVAILSGGIKPQFVK